MIPVIGLRHGGQPAASVSGPGSDHSKEASRKSALIKKTQGKTKEEDEKNNG